MSEEIDKKRKTGWKQKMRRVGSQWRDKKKVDERMWRRTESHQRDSYRLVRRKDREKS